MLRGGVIGFGRMGVTHYSILNTHPDVKFVAVCDSMQVILKNLKRYTGIETFTDYKKMFKNVDMDFVIVCTPTASHGEIGLAAAERGIHMFMEKPFALTVEEGQRLIDAVEAKNLVNQVGYFLRYQHVFAKVKALIDDGTIGDVIHYKNEMYGRTVLKASKSSWRAKRNMGGGCMMDFGSHCLDMTDYLFGPVQSVCGSLLRMVYNTEVEDGVYTNMTHSGGVTGTIMVNWSDASMRRPYNSIEILGTKGKIYADRQEYRLFLRDADPKGRYEEGWTIEYLPAMHPGVRFAVRGPEFTEQLDDFVECIQQGRPSRCTFADALRTDGVMEMILKDYSARS